MDIRFNLHTHTNFCDGLNTPEELVKMAIEKGFSYLGFSGHAYTPFDTRYCMSLENTERYKEEIFNLKYRYRDKIKIFCGLEYDYYSECETKDFDFLIGSVHYLKINGEYYSIDSSLNHFLDVLKVLNNDMNAFIERYYETMSKMPKVDIIGHFDYVTKFNGTGEYFDENDPSYLKVVDASLEKLMKKNRVFEVNTGSLARGLRNSPYPNKNVMDMIIEKGGNFILSSDCHKAEFLDCAFDDVLKKYGEGYFLKNPDFLKLK